MAVGGERSPRTPRALRRGMVATRRAMRAARRSAALLDKERILEAVAAPLATVGFGVFRIALWLRQNAIRLLIVIFGLAAATVGAWSLLGMVPLLVGDALDAADPQDAVILRFTGIAVVGILGLPLLFLRAWSNERHTQAAEAQVRIAEQGQITERFIKATELLGAVRPSRREGVEVMEPALELRLGGIYALERLAKESLDDHVTIMRTLAAYVRENRRSPQQVTAERGEARDVLSEDVAAILSIVARRNAAQISVELEEAAPFPWASLDLRGADLRGVFANPAAAPEARRLSGINLSHADLRGVDFSFADLSGGDFTNARLDGANLAGADLSGADLHDASLMGADLTWANLKGAQLDFSLMRGASIAGARLSQEGAQAQPGAGTAGERQDGDRDQQPARGLGEREAPMADLERIFADESAAEGLARVALDVPGAWRARPSFNDIASAQSAWRAWLQHRQAGSGAHRSGQEPLPQGVR